MAVYKPIWEDTYYTTSADSVVYRIELDGDNIYSGRAVKYPDAEELNININKICRNYLESDIVELLTLMPATLLSQSHPHEQREFKLYVDDVNVEDYVFYQDYSYNDDKPVGGSINVSNPINGHYVPGMLRLSTTRRTSLTGGTSDAFTQGLAGEPTTPAEYLGYETQVKCAPYVLYYLNSYGGWDAFVIEGNTIKKDTYTSYQTDRTFNNTTIEFETNKYVNEIKTSYELNTGLLNDEQSANLAKNLIGSIKVYLQNIEEGWVKPVIIADNTATYQTYQGNKRKLCQYKITVQESQSKVRR